MQSLSAFLCCAKEKQMAESGILFFFALFYKKAKICFYCQCTQIKANLLQFRLSSRLRGVVASTVRRGKSQVIAPAPHDHTVKLSTFTMQPVN